FEGLLALIHKIYKLLVLSCVIILSMASCGPSKSQNENSSLKWRFFTNPLAFNGIHESEIRLCVLAQKSVGLSVADSAKRNGILALSTWVKLVAKMSPWVNPKIVYSCKSPHYNIKIYSTDSFARQFNRELRSFVSLSETNTIFTHTNAVNTAGLLLHEFGHAFAGLGDTYVNGGNFDCQTGQPPSLMCSHFRFGSRIMSDDIEGLKSGYSLKVGDYVSSNSTPTTLKFQDLSPKVIGVSYNDGFPAKLTIGMKRPSIQQDTDGSQKIQLVWDLGINPKIESNRFFEELKRMFQ
ncbi:MAG: hypothetical protein NT027_16230, partial [Proteobacteria bacterium]|nr:hypothetical protein [Pseudomonadota bacterium]